MSEVTDQVKNYKVCDTKSFQPIVRNVQRESDQTMWHIHAPTPLTGWLTTTALLIRPQQEPQLTLSPAIQRMVSFKRYSSASSPRTSCTSWASSSFSVSAPQGGSWSHVELVHKSSRVGLGPVQAEYDRRLLRHVSVVLRANASATTVSHSPEVAMPRSRTYSAYN